jgi:hypothetical protein
MIPKRIHLCWLSGDPYPPKIRKCIKSWEKHLPDYEIIKWDLNRFDISNTPWVKQAFEAKKYAFAADYIRFYALYNYGGIYLDSDVEILKNLDELLELPYFVGLETAGTIEAAVMGAEKGCDWIKYCLDYYENKNFILPDGKMDIRKLPEIMDEVIKEHKSIIQLSGKADFEKLSASDVSRAVHVFPKDFFSPKTFDSRTILANKNTFAIHHYQNSWFSKKAYFYYRIRALFINLFGYGLVRKIERTFLTK